MIFWIASYPKSGNTWLRSLLSSYYYSNNGFFHQNLLENIRQFPEKSFFANFNYKRDSVTDTSRFWIEAQEKINQDNKLKFLKTHNLLGSINNYEFTNNKNSLGAIYVVRDPRNIITSLKNHFELSLDMALEFMMNERKYIYDYFKKNDYSDFQFLGSWEKNYQSWIRQNNIPVKLVKYEDLNLKTFEIFKEIVEFIEKISKNQKKFNVLKAKNAIHSTSFSKMQKIENDQGFSESLLSKNNLKKIPFFHLGPDNNWKHILSESYKKKVNFVFEKNLRELNYV